MREPSTRPPSYPTPWKLTRYNNSYEYIEEVSYFKEAYAQKVL